jgi:DUF1009 family protein
MIAIIAGTGTLPIEACKSLLDRGSQFFVLCLFPEDNLNDLQQITQGKAEVVFHDFFKVGQALKLLKTRNVKQVLLIGKVDKNHLLKNLKLDWLAIKMLTSLLYKSDAAIMERVVKELEGNGIEVLHQNAVLDSLFVPPGVLTGKLTDDLQKDIQLGINTAIKMSESDIGQTVVVKDQMILAIEAIEGTDKCIQRGVELGHGSVVVCKAAWHNQNKKFDLPTLGPNSLKDLCPGQVKVLAWLCDKTMIAQKEAFIKRAQELGITLVSYKKESEAGPQ